jgi:DNA uptake protein ComE-like DNA-binding protein
MKTTLLAALIFSCITSLSHADPKAKKETSKPAETVKKAVKKAEGAEKKAEKKTTELSDADKALQENAKKAYAELTAAQKARFMDLVNKGDSKVLQEVDGLGEVKAKSIIAKRPFASAEDVIMVEGIGEDTFNNIIAFAKDKNAKAEPKAETEKKPEAKTEKKAAATKEEKPKKK